MIESYESTLPVKIKNTKISIQILPQIDAEDHKPHSNEALISIVGNGWKLFNSVHSEPYDYGILALSIDDIGANLTPEALKTLINGINDAIALVKKLHQEDKPILLTIHCFAGMSRSTAFAVGCAAALDLDNIDENIQNLAKHVTISGRKFIPNPLIVNYFEEEMGLDYGYLSISCSQVSEHS